MVKVRNRMIVDAATTGTEIVELVELKLTVKWFHR